MARLSRAQPAAAGHSLDLHGSPRDSREHPVACPYLYTCAPCRRLVGRCNPNEPNSKEVDRRILSPRTASDSSLRCTQACRSTSTRHDDSQGAQPFHQLAIHAAKGSMASGKEAGQVPHMFKCIEASPDAIARALSRIHTHWCCRTPCHISQSCETVATAARVSKASRRCHLRPLRP